MSVLCDSLLGNPLEKVSFFSKFYRLQALETYTFAGITSLICGIGGSTESIFCTDRVGARVYIFNSLLQPQGSFSCSGQSITSSVQLADLVWVDDSLLVADLGNAVINRFDRTGKFLGRYMDKTGPVSLDSGFTVVAGEGGIFLLNDLKQSVYFLDLHGAVVRKQRLNIPAGERCNRLFYEETDAVLYVGTAGGSIYAMDSRSLSQCSKIFDLRLHHPVTRISDFCIKGKDMFFIDVKSKALIKIGKDRHHFTWTHKGGELTRLLLSNDTLFLASAPGRDTASKLMSFQI